MIATGILILTSLFLQGCAQNVKGSLRKQVNIVEEIEKIEKQCKSLKKDSRVVSSDRTDNGEKVWQKCNDTCYKNNDKNINKCYESTQYKKYLNQLKKNAMSANKKYKNVTEISYLLSKMMNLKKNANKYQKKCNYGLKRRAAME